MRKALVAATSFLTVPALLLLFVNSSFGMDEKRSFCSLKYNYVIQSELTLQDFSGAFFDRLKNKHSWSEVSRNVCDGQTCTSSWSFKDDDLHEWKCEVVIQKSAEAPNTMLVTMEMNPVLGS